MTALPTATGSPTASAVAEGQAEVHDRRRELLRECVRNVSTPGG